MLDAEQSIVDEVEAAIKYRLGGKTPGNRQARHRPLSGVRRRLQ